MAASWVPYGPDTMLVWQGQRLLYRVDGEDYQAIAFSTNGAVLATANDPHGVVLRDATTGAVFAERWLSASP